ncbi:MAG: hypothetical protein WD377_09600 [Nitriliruptoraceae bacterium]
MGARLAGRRVTFDASITDVTAFLRVALGMTLAFGVLPMVVLPYPAGTRSLLDAWIANLVRWCAIVIVLMHVLAGIGIYSRVSLFVCIFVIAWQTRYKKQLGGFGGLLQRLYSRGEDDELDNRVRTPMRDRIRIALLVVPVVLLFVATYALRAHEAFASLALSPPDTYVHMAWANDFTQGIVWGDGVYPQGLAALVALISVFAPFTDFLDIARFSGPMVGTFVVLAIYYAVVRLTRNPGAAFFAAGMIGLFGAMPELRVPWERNIGLLPQEFGLAIAFCAVVFAVLAVTERGGGRLLQMAGGGIALNGNVLSLAAAGFVVAMCHPISAGWLGIIVGVSATTAALVTRRFAQLFGAGIATVSGVGIGIAVVPVAELLGVSAYLGYGASDAFGDLSGISDRSTQTAELLEDFGDLVWLGHNWLSEYAIVAVAVGVVAAVVLIVRPATRIHGAQLLGLSAVGALTVGLYDVTGIAYRVESFYVVRLATLMGPTLALAFGAGLGGLGILVARRVSYVRVATLALVGLLALGGFTLLVASPSVASGLTYERQQIEYDEMVRFVREIREEFDAGTYTIVGPTSVRQVLAGHGFSIEQWVFARDIDEVPHEEIVPVPTPDTFVFVEMDPYPVRVLEPDSATEEYYFVPEKRGRIQTVLYEWAEMRRRTNPDTTLYLEGEHVRVYRVARNPAVQIEQDAELFTDYTWRRNELFDEGPTSPREIQPRIEALPEPDFDESDTTVDSAGVFEDDA